MRRSAKRVLLGGTLGAGVVATSAVLLASGRTAPEAATGNHPVRTQAGRTASCTERLLKDWRDGRIDGMYSIACYRHAMAHLPTDVRVYSSAEQDIQRALSERIARGSR